MEDSVSLLAVGLLHVVVIFLSELLKLCRRHCYRGTSIAHDYFVIEIEEGTRFELPKFSDLEPFFVKLIKNRKVLGIVLDVDTCKDERGVLKF